MPPKAKRDIKKPDLRGLPLFLVPEQTFKKRERLPSWFLFHADQMGNLPIVESLPLDPSIKPPEET